MKTMIMAACAMLFSITVCAESVTISVTGRVQLNGDASPPAIRIRLQRLGITVREQSSRDGHFSFEGVEPGPYSLLADAAGYTSILKDIDVPASPDIVIEMRGNKPRLPGGKLVASVFDYRILRSATREYDQAEKEIKRGDRIAGLEHLKKVEQVLISAIRQHPRHDPDTHLLLAKVYLAQERKDPMIEELRMFVEEAEPSPLRTRIETALSPFLP